VDDTVNEPTDTSVYAIAWSIPVAIADPGVNEKSQHSSSDDTATCDKTFHHFYALMKASTVMYKFAFYMGDAHCPLSN